MSKLATLTLAACLSACAGADPLIIRSDKVWQSDKSDSLRVVSFNLYNRPWERKERLLAAADLLARVDADVVALQEVATGWILPGDPMDLFARRLEMNGVRYWHERNLGIFKTGIAVLSKYPILSSEYHEFEDHQFWDAKGYMLVKIQGPKGVLQVINLHMASTSNESIRKSEWQELTRFVQPLTAQGSVLIAGDFNTLPTHPALMEFFRSTGASSIYDGRTDLEQLRSWTNDYRRRCDDVSDPKAELLDYVFVVPASAPNPAIMRFRRGQILSPEREPHPSDHCPVVAEISLL